MKPRRPHSAGARQHTPRASATACTAHGGMAGRLHSAPGAVRCAMIFLPVRGGWLGGGWGVGGGAGRCRWPLGLDITAIWFVGWIGNYGSGPYYVGGPVAVLGSSPAQQLLYLSSPFSVFFPPSLLLYATEIKPGARQPGPLLHDCCSANLI
ncbi:hypothetical protein PVAP13_1NG499019 [Panicum virgatum]|uniref:Uncharacterized protein n=1 Tax=Panicum virgatum TaxID=38727 RepID=A0A8T0XBV6_PANVG|nr:hypothetical protein PVAP13_1NG499019 [Panicum virgatum]